METEYLSSEQAAARLGVTRAAINQAIHKGTLPAQRVGRCWIIRAEDVAAYVVAPGARKTARKTESSRRNAALATAALAKKRADRRKN
jgi:excisionase family DNA binding protein